MFRLHVKVVDNQTVKITKNGGKPRPDPPRGGRMDDATLRHLAAAIYEMLPHNKNEALVALRYASWLVEANWGRSGGEVIQMDSSPRLIRKAAE